MSSKIAIVATSSILEGFITAGEGLSEDVAEMAKHKYGGSSFRSFSKIAKCRTETQAYGAGSNSIE